MPISGPIVKAKAEIYAKLLGITCFKASEVWLGKFKQRHHISYGKANGEARDVTYHEWIEKVWPNLKEKYASSDIFNASET